MRTLYAIVCMRALRDADANRVSAIDLLEGFAASSFPVVFPRVSIVWTLHRNAGEPEQLQGTVTLTLNEQQLQVFPVEFNFNGVLSTRSMLAVGGLALTGPGHVRFRFEAPGVETANWEFDVDAQPGVQPVEGALIAM